MYLSAFCWPDTDTDNKNATGQTQMQTLKNATVCQDNRYFAGYPSIPSKRNIDSPKRIREQH